LFSLPQPSKHLLRYSTLVYLFILFFLTVGSLYVKHTMHLERKQFNHHVMVIADDIWALNQSGAKAYLKLAVVTHNYEFLHVDIPGNSDYLDVHSPPLHGIVKLFHQAHLIPTMRHSAKITYGEYTIGTLSGTQRILVIFPLFNILVFLLLLLTASCFMLYLNRHRQNLQQQVEERTENLRQSERRFHDLVNLLPEMVLETDSAGTIQYANRTARETLALEDSPATTNFFDLISVQDQGLERQKFENSLLAEKSSLSEVTLYPPDGRHIPVLIRSAAMHKKNSVIGARMIVIDISERRQLEEQLHRDRKMKAIGLMAGGVAHDLNNILSGIISYPELLLLELDEHSAMRRPLEAIRSSGLEAANVVADLLTVARGIAPVRESASLNTLINNYLQSPDYMQLVNRYSLVKVTTTLAKDLAPISCSPIHVRKCLMNLVTNGFEAIQGIGSLTIVSAEMLLPSASIADSNNLAPGRYSTVTISDTGGGISKEEMERIFEPFYTKKVMGRSGTGLGLAVVWNTMRDHGGRVWVESNDKGTRFTLIFPSIEKKDNSSAASTSRHEIKGNGERILVVDDEARQREIATELLIALNYRVETATSGEAAVAYCRDYEADLILLDMLMMPGQNGRATYEQIRRLRPRQKVIIVSGFAEDDDVQATLQMGALAFVSKPYTVQTLSLAIHQAIHQEGWEGLCTATNQS